MNKHRKKLTELLSKKKVKTDQIKTKELEKEIKEAFLSIEDRLSIVQANSRLEGVELSAEALNRCRKVMEGKLTADEAIKQIVKEIK